MSLETKLNQYAQLIIKRGVNVQPGQTIILYAVDEAYFARKVVNAAMQPAQGESLLRSDQQIDKDFLSHTPIERLEYVPKYEIDKANTLMDNFASRISLLSQDPDGLATVDSKRLSTYLKRNKKALSRVREATVKDDIHGWLSLLLDAWAEKVFPDLHGEAAVQRLWKKY